MSFLFGDTPVILQYFISQFNDLEKEISNRGRARMDKIEAKLFYDHLTSIYEQLIELEIRIKDGKTGCIRDLETIRPYQLKVIHLKTKLTKIFSLIESEANNPTNLTQCIQTVPELVSQIQKQNFLINFIKSFKIPDDIYTSEAEVLNDQLNQLKDSFVYNQMEIEAIVDGIILENRQKIVIASKEVIDIVSPSGSPSA